MIKSTETLLKEEEESQKNRIWPALDPHSMVVKFKPEVIIIPDSPKTHNTQNFCSDINSDENFSDLEVLKEIQEYHRASTPEFFPEELIFQN